MKIGRILQILMICVTFVLAMGCANRSTYNPYQQYPQYPQQYGQQPMQGYPYGQPGQIQASPQVGAPPGAMQPGQQMQPYYGPPQGQAPPPFIGR